MGVFRQFPYSNFHEMNMDEIIKIVKHMLEEWAEYYDTWDDWKTQVTNEWSEMQTFINTYFDNLDVQTEINNKINDMIDSGEFSSIVSPFIPPEVSSWLAAHITTPESVVIDTSLTVAGACADAKATGDAIADVITDLSHFEEDVAETFTKTLPAGNTYATGAYINTNGEQVPSTSYDYTSSIAVHEGDVVKAVNGNLNLRFVTAYRNGVVVPSKGTQSVNRYTVPRGIDSVVISLQTTYNQPPLEIIRTYFKLNGAALIDNTVAQEAVSFIVHDPESNYIKYDNITDHSYVYSDGTLHYDLNLVATDFIELDEDLSYYWNALYDSYYAFYDEDKTFISSYSTLGDLTNPISIPENAVYARFSILRTRYTSNAAWINIENVTPPDYRYSLLPNIIAQGGDPEDNPCNYEGDEISVFNKILCIGDSLTAGTFNYYESGSIYHTVEDAKYSYPTFLKKMTGVDITNLGRGGRTSDQWYALYENADLSGYDCAIIQLGVNDVLTYTTWGNTSETAFENIITKLKAENKNIKIFVANIIPATAYSSANYVNFSNDMLDWLNTEYENDPDVIALDMHKYGNTATNSAYNLGHLSAIGYHQLALDYKGYISHYISRHMMDFSEVQFIGTDYYYAH